MIKIENTIVSFDVIEQFFCCDLNNCLGVCCIEGDAGAPLSEEEDTKLKALYPKIKPLLSPKAAATIEVEGASYRDPEGDLVTQLTDGAACVYTCFEKNGMCLCALEKACREGKAHFFKPISCSLYPIRIKDYGNFIAVNYDRWKICSDGETLGKKKGIRVYEFLKDPLIRRFGADWYIKLELAAREWLRQKDTKQ